MRSKGTREFGMAWYGVFGLIVFMWLTMVVYAILHHVFFPDFKHMIIETVIIISGGSVGFYLFGRAAKRSFERMDEEQGE